MIKNSVVLTGIAFMGVLVMYGYSDKENDREIKPTNKGNDVVNINTVKINKTQDPNKNESLPMVKMEDPVDPSKAFKYTTKLNSKGDAVEVNIDIKDGYKLYKDKLSINLVGAEYDMGKVVYPKFILVEDPIFGKSEVYKDNFNVMIGIKPTQDKILVNTKYQGCWDGGVCYPPESKKDELTIK